MPVKNQPDDTTAINPTLTQDPNFTNPVTVPSTPSVEQNAIVMQHGVYATEYYKAHGIPYCLKCGEQYHHDENGFAVCAEGWTRSQGCPRLQ